MNVVQQTFYYNYKYLPMKPYQHRVINWDHMNLAAGVDIKKYFDDHPGLADLVSLHHQYVEDWVRIFMLLRTLLRLGSTSCSCFRDANILFSDTKLLALLD